MSFQPGESEPDQLAKDQLHQNFISQLWRETKKVEELQEFRFSLRQSINLLHWVGYGLLILALFDYIEIFVPLDLINPAWGFQTLGAMVERVAVPLIGLVLVFLGEKNMRTRREIPILKFITWGALCLGVLYLLLVPWGIYNTLVLQNYSHRQITAQLNQSLTQLQQVKDQLEKATTAEELEEIVSRLNSQGRPAKFKNSSSLAEVKEELSSFLVSKESQLKSQAKKAQFSQLMKLLKSSVKWNLGALVGGVLILRIWKEGF